MIKRFQTLSSLRRYGKGGGGGGVGGSGYGGGSGGSVSGGIKRTSSGGVAGARRPGVYVSVTVPRKVVPTIRAQAASVVAMLSGCS